MTIGFSDYLYDIDPTALQAFRKCGAEKLLRQSKMIQSELHKLVAIHDPRSDGVFRLALAEATTKLTARLRRPWAMEEAKMVNLHDQTFREYNAFRSLMDCLFGEGLALQEILEAAIRILCDQLAFVESG